MANKKTNTIKETVNFSAINPTIEVNIPSAAECDVKGKDFVAYGEHNDYPDYLYSLYEDVPTLASIINGTIDYICGNDVTCNVERFSKTVNRKGETLNDVFEKCAMDKIVFGGYYLNIIRDAKGEVAEIYWLDFRNVRTDKKNEVFYYSEDWSRSYGRVKYLVYPKFVQSFNQASSVMFVKGSKSRETYPRPIYYPSIKSCEIERKINNFHLNSISNGLVASYLINFNNGTPSDELKNEIEKNINEKFAGDDNAGRIMLSFNSDKDHSAELIPLDVTDFGVKYQTLADRSRNQIFISFGTSGALFGNTQDGIGFNNQEYMAQFALYNKTRILPIQKEMCDSFDKIFGVENSVSIEPFSIVFEDSELNNVETESENIE